MRWLAELQAQVYKQHWAYGFENEPFVQVGHSRVEAFS
jgi:hypothetical protein